MDAQAVMRAFARSAETSREREVEKFRDPTIVVSRTMGSGGNEIADAVAARLDLPVYGSDILDKVAKQAKVDRGLMANLNEMAGAQHNAWLFATVFGKSVSRDDYMNHLATTIRGLYRLGGVILGRGAYIILEDKDVLRVRVVGSVAACARRVAEEDGSDVERAERKVRQSNRKRGKFVWDMFRRRLNDPSNFDLVISTDHFDHDDAVEMILQAAHARGLDKPIPVVAGG